MSQAKMFTHSGAANGRIRLQLIVVPQNVLFSGLKIRSFCQRFFARYLMCECGPKVQLFGTMVSKLFYNVNRHWHWTFVCACASVCVQQPIRHPHKTCERRTKENGHSRRQRWHRNRRQRWQHITGSVINWAQERWWIAVLWRRTSRLGWWARLYDRVFIGFPAYGQSQSLKIHKREMVGWRRNWEGGEHRCIRCVHSRCNSRKSYRKFVHAARVSTAWSNSSARNHFYIAAGVLQAKLLTSRADIAQKGRIQSVDIILMLSID